PALSRFFSVVEEQRVQSPDPAVGLANFGLPVRGPLTAPTDAHRSDASGPSASLAARGGQTTPTWWLNPNTGVSYAVTTPSHVLPNASRDLLSTAGRGHCTAERRGRPTAGVSVTGASRKFEKADVRRATGG